MTHSTDHPAESADIQVIVHLGAHKTATTYIQARLARSEKSLQQRGVFFVRTGEMRKAFLRIYGTYTLLNKIRPVRLWRKANVYRKFLRDAKSARCMRMILSEENLLGPFSMLMETGQFYPEIQKRLRPVFQVYHRQPVTVLLAVRSYDSFFASVCSQSIRSEGYGKIGAEIKTRLLAHSRGWVEVVEDVMQVLPAGYQVRVWRYEDFTNDEVPMMGALVREVNLECLTSLDSRPLPRLSMRAMKRLAELHADGKPTGPPVVKRLGNRFSVENGFKPFSPWTEEENAILARQYHEDVARIRERWPGIMIELHNAG